MYNVHVYIYETVYKRVDKNVDDYSRRRRNKEKSFIAFIYINININIHRKELRDEFWQRTMGGVRRSVCLRL